MSLRALEKALQFVEFCEILPQKHLAIRTAELLTAWAGGKQLFMIDKFDNTHRKMKSPYDRIGQLWIMEDNIMQWYIEGEKGGAA